MYKSDSSYPINDETKSNLYFGMVQGRGIQDYEGDDFWSLNTKDDMFGLYLAQFESSSVVPFYPSNTTELKWSRADFGLESIQPIHNGKTLLQIFLDGSESLALSLMTGFWGIVKSADSEG